MINKSKGPCDFLQRTYRKKTSEKFININN